MTTVVDGDVRCIDRIGQQIAYVTADGTITLCDETLTDCTSSPTPSSDIVVQMTSEMADPNVMYLLTDQSQVFLSEDGGETWELLIDGGP